MLVLGSQILLGFQLQGTFRPVFEQLPFYDRILHVAALLLITLTIGLLIAPSMQHQIVEEGDDTYRIIQVIGRYASLALAPFAAALGIGIFMATERILGTAGGLLIGSLFFGLAMLFWYGLEIIRKRTSGHMERAMAQQKTSQEQTPLDVKIDQMLTEARVMLPGVQALLGFQLVITLAETFEKLSFDSKLIHLGALAAITFSVIFLMAPAAFHRIVYNGEDSQEFLVTGSRFILAASGALAIGIAADLYVVVSRSLSSEMAGLTAAVASLIVLLGLWYAIPFALRIFSRSGTTRSSPQGA